MQNLLHVPTAAISGAKPELLGLNQTIPTCIYCRLSGLMYLLRYLLHVPISGALVSVPTAARTYWVPTAVRM